MDFYRVSMTIDLLQLERPVVMSSTSKTFADKALKAASIFWFAAAAAGLALFALYIAVFYGTSTLSGDIELWNRNTRAEGYVAGDNPGNFAFGVHVLLATILALGGVIQLVPQIRARAAAFHRWNGRIFLTAAFVVSLAGLALIALRGSGGFDPLAIGINAVLILVFGAVAWRYARARKFDQHRRWALRAFMVVNGVWFIRIGVNLFAVIHVGLLGGAEADVETFFQLWMYGSYLVPLTVLELYFYTQDRGGPALKIAVAALVAVLALATAGGSVFAYLNFWAPLIFPA